MAAWYVRASAYGSSGDNLRTYLQFNPGAPDASAVQQQIAELEKKSGAGK